MQRRSFIKNAALGATASLGAIAAPALAQSTPTINWRLASSFPKSLDTIFGGSERMCKRISELTGGKFNIRAFPGGEIVPPFEVMGAVQNGTVEMAHTVSQYFSGVDSAFTFDSGLPFGLNSRQQTAWFEKGGGKELLREFFKEYGIINFMGGNTGTQMGGFFRKEINTVADINGLKFRIGGMAGRIFEKLGAVPQQIPAGDVYSALEKGTIDAAEFVGPFDDEKLGFNKVAPYYYAPGWWDAGPQESFYVGIKAWDQLPKEYQAALETATYETHVQIQAQYDAANPAALARILKNGGQLRWFSKEIMEECYKLSNELFLTEAERNPRFKKILDPWLRFRDDSNQWFSVAEGPMQNFLASVK
ncbi:TRAP transporter substrate-binding protein [Pollutimonas thiosulfatoxidans]|uniref:ABC transporter substrate-binding protein n=1 Tax=Pollutimonas thiosulfatoxidans TaxID=2028345 RepID=A0A410G8X0_9BURK|nr:TRAP transporter substrate-binding protein DctP [Pollutimonas thiosulfatoxidans]QAA92655.1 ABC transporter substrate-binding protein [Pollutimonas thiosulfatoxidans]